MSKGSKIKVQPIRFHRRDIDDPESLVGPDSPPYSVERTRAAELKANGIVEIIGDDHDEPEKEPERTPEAARAPEALTEASVTGRARRLKG